MLIHDVLAEYLLTQGDTEVKDYDIGNTIERLTHQIDGEPTPLDLQYTVSTTLINPIALRKAKILCNFGLSECNRVKEQSYSFTSVGHMWSYCLACNKKK